jgi:hypothetical protein
MAAGHRRQCRQLSFPTRRANRKVTARGGANNLLGPGDKASETVQLSHDLFTAFESAWCFGNRPENPGFAWSVKRLISKTG